MHKSEVINVVSTRAPWLEVEKDFLKILIGHAIEDTKRKPTPREWQVIANSFNARFEGTMALVGAKTVPAPHKPEKDWRPRQTMEEGVPEGMFGTSEHQNSRAKYVRKNVLKRSHIHEQRSWNSMRTQVARWPDLSAWMTDKIAATNPAGASISRVLADNNPQPDQDLEFDDEGECSAEEDLDTYCVHRTQHRP